MTSIGKTLLRRIGKATIGRIERIEECNARVVQHLPEASLSLLHKKITEFTLGPWRESGFE
jgi:hypothetical protein